MLRTTTFSLPCATTYSGSQIDLFLVWDRLTQEHNKLNKIWAVLVPLRRLFLLFRSDFDVHWITICLHWKKLQRRIIFVAMTLLNLSTALLSTSSIKLWFLSANCATSVFIFCHSKQAKNGLGAPERILCLHNCWLQFLWTLKAWQLNALMSLYNPS